MIQKSLLSLLIFIFPLLVFCQVTSDTSSQNIEEIVQDLKKINNEDAQYQLALIYLQQEEYKFAIKTAKRLSKKDKLSTEVGLGSLLIQIAAYTQLEKDKKVEKVYSEAFKKYPLHYLLYQNYGIRQLERGNLEVAEQNIQKSISLKPNKAELHLILSQIQEAKGNRIKAILPLYAYVIFSEDDSQNKITNTKLKSLVYSGIEVVQESGLSFTLPFSKDSEDPELQTLEVMINDIQTDSLSLLNNDLMKFHVYTHTIFKFMYEYQYSKQDFWWDTYGKLLGEIYQENLVKPFVFSLIKNDSPEYKKYMIENAYEVRAYRDWLQQVRIY